MKLFDHDESSDISSRRKRFASVAAKFLVVIVPVAFIYAANPFIPEFYGSGSPGPAPGAPAARAVVEESRPAETEPETVVNDEPTFIDPDWIGASYYDSKGNLLQNVSLGRQKQGLAGSVVFATSTPAGWKEAFPFSMTINGVSDNSLKDGILKIHIPGPCQKAGRQFAVLAIDKNGRIHVYQDADPQANVFSAKLDVEGYAFDLIYFD